jgi:hypothetical protein
MQMYVAVLTTFVQVDRLQKHRRCMRYVPRTAATASASNIQLDIRVPRRGRVSNYNQADAWSICLDAQNSISVNGLLIDLAYLCRLVPEDLHYLPSFSLVTDLFLN